MKIIAPLGCAALLALVSLAPGARAQDAPAAPPPAAAAPSDAVTLRLRLPAGKTFNVRYDSTQKITQTIRGRAMTIDQTMGTDYLFRVDSVDAAGNARITGTIKTVQWRNNNSLSGEQVYDSTQPGVPAAPGAQSMAAMVDSSFSMRVSPTGRVLGVVGMDALFQKSASAVSGVPAAERAALLKQMKEQFGDRAMQQMMDQAMNFLPEKPVRIGDSWKRRVSMAGAFPLVLDTVYTLKERRDGIAVLSTVSSISSPAKGGSMKIGKATLSFRLKGKQTGTIEVDEATGWSRSSRGSLGLSGRATMTGIPGEKKPVTWPMWMKVETTMLSD